MVNDVTQSRQYLRPDPFRPGIWSQCVGVCVRVHERMLAQCSLTLAVREESSSSTAAIEQIYICIAYVCKQYWHVF